MNTNFPNFGAMGPSAPPSFGFGAPAMGSGLMLQQAMMNQMMTQMMATMQMLFQQILGSSGSGGMAPTGASFGGSSPGAGVDSFLGGSPGARESSGTRGSTSSPSTAPATDLSKVEGTEFGKKFAAQAEKTARRINTPGLCLKGVNDTMEAMGMPVQREASAYMALDNFRNNKRFQEVKVSKEQLKSLPAGAVVIWDKGSGLPHGHISVALGNGREASSTVRDQLRLNTNFHVFVPKG